MMKMIQIGTVENMELFRKEMEALPRDYKVQIMGYACCIVVYIDKDERHVLIDKESYVDSNYGFEAGSKRRVNVKGNKFKIRMGEEFTINELMHELSKLPGDYTVSICGIYDLFVAVDPGEKKVVFDEECDIMELIDEDDEVE